jgi:hypothetical protein
VVTFDGRPSYLRSAVWAPDQTAAAGFALHFGIRHLGRREFVLDLGIRHEHANPPAIA